MRRAPRARRSLRSTLNCTLSLDFALVVQDPKLPSPPTLYSPNPLSLVIDSSRRWSALCSDGHREIGPQSHRTVNVAPQIQDLETERKKEAKKNSPRCRRSRDMGSCNPARGLWRSSPISGAFSTTSHLGMPGWRCSGRDRVIRACDSVRPVWFESDSLGSPGHPADVGVFSSFPGLWSWRAGGHHDPGHLPCCEADAVVGK